MSSPDKDVEEEQFDPKQGPKQEKRAVGETQRKISKEQIERAKKNK